MSITLAELKLQSRERADMVESEFVTDTELLSYINSSLAELHDLLIAAYSEEYYMTEYEFVGDGSQAYALPADFYKLRGVDIQDNGDAWRTVKRFNFNKRNEGDNPSMQLMGLPYIQYRLVGSNIRFNKIPDGNTTFRIWYYPASVKLAVDADEFDDINGYAEYVIVDAAIKMLNKEESDVSVLMAQKEALRQRLIGMADNRDANEPESVSDVYAEDADYTVLGSGSY